MKSRIYTLEESLYSPIMISLIAAMAKNRVIGKKGELPWHMPSDFAYFKKMTQGKPIVMGRKTYDSLGHPLPRRRNIVISRQSKQLEGCELVHSLEEAIALIDDPDQEIMIIGGGRIYELALPIADRLYLTFIDCEVEGDTQFPMWDEALWQEVSSTSCPPDEKNPYAYRFVVLEKKAPQQTTGQ